MCIRDRFCQSESALHDVAAYWQARYEEQKDLQQKMAALQRQIACLRRQADRESHAAQAEVLRSEARGLGQQYEALRQQRAQNGGSKSIEIYVGVGGLSQADRDAWNTYAQLELDPDETPGTRMRRSTVVRMPPWRRLFDAGWGLLWLPERPVQRERAIAHIMAHLLIYLWQVGMAEREEVAPWLQGYIQSVCRTMPHSDLGYALEVMLKEFTLPMHASTLQTFLAKQHSERIDQRLERDAVPEATQGEDDTTGRDVRQGRRRQTRPRSLLREEPQQSSSSQEVARQSGLSAHKVRYQSQRMGLRVERLGPYVQYAPTAGERLRQEEQRKQLRKGLIYLRALVQSVHTETKEAVTTLCKPGGAAYKWLDRQQHAGKTPAQVLATLENDPALSEVIRRQPNLGPQLRTLIEQLGPEVTWPEKHYQRTNSPQRRPLSSRKRPTLPNAASEEDAHEASPA